MRDSIRSLGVLLMVSFVCSVWGNAVWSAETWPFLGDTDTRIESVEKLTTKNYMLIFDGSGSMSEFECVGRKGGLNKCDVAKKAASEWFKSIPADANVGLLAFHSSGWSRVALGARNRSDLSAVIEAVKPGGNTPLGAAFEQAYNALTAQAKKQLGYGEYTIVVVTDGEATDLDRLKEWTRYILGVSPIAVYTIGFCIGQDHALNQPQRTVYRTAQNPVSLRQGLKEVLAESELFDISVFK
jgi:uncharacterized protein YegL